MVRTAAGLADSWRRLAGLPYFTSSVSAALLALLFAGGALAYPSFLSLQVVCNLLIDNAFLLVLAVGMGFVILSGGIDLSVGSVLALTTMSAAWMMQLWHWPAPVAIACCLAGGSLFGALMGTLIQVFKLQPFIVTLGGMFLARGLCYLVSIDSMPIDNAFFVAVSQTQIEVFGAFISPAAVVALVLLAVAIAVAHFTAIGRSVYAIGGNERSALMMGLPVARTKILIYAFSGFCSALAGILFSFYMLSGYALHAQGVELDAIAAVVIGGTLLTGGSGYIAGALTGVLVLGVIQTLIAFDGTLSSWWTRIVIGALLFAFCVVQRIVILSARRR